MQPTYLWTQEHSVVGVVGVEVGHNTYLNTFHGLCQAIQQTANPSFMCFISTKILTFPVMDVVPI